MQPSAEQIAYVRNNIPTKAADLYDWDDTKITDVLKDTLPSVAEAVRRFWLQRVNDTAEFVDVNESGSGRPLSQMHVQALEMLKYWDAMVNAEGIEVQRQPISFGTIDVS
jgi:hypothetical protein